MYSRGTARYDAAPGTFSPSRIWILDAMDSRIGNGLPSTLTVTRIKAVLGLAESQERALEEALEADASPAWTETTSNGDLYERLHVLLATVEAGKPTRRRGPASQRVDNKQFRRTNFPSACSKAAGMKRSASRPPRLTPALPIKTCSSASSRTPLGRAWRRSSGRKA